MKAMEGNKRKRWTREETLLFLDCYAARKNEFTHPRKKKYANVLEDMVAQGFSDTNVTAVSLEARLRTLLTAYKCAKDNARQTGSGQCTVPYITELEEIFGREPIISNAHTLSLGSKQTSASPEGPQKNSDERANIEEISVDDDDSRTEVAFVCESELSCSSKTPKPNCRKRKTTKEQYYEKKLEIKKKLYEEVRGMLKEKFKNDERRAEEKHEIYKNAMNNSSK